MKYTYINRVLGTTGTIVTLCLFALIINACTTPATEKHAANINSRTVTNASAAMEDTFASTMNQLADDLCNGQCTKTA